MPMFYTPKPRQFHYEPRFYDPEKERWEALKKKYADETQKQASDTEHAEQPAGEDNGKGLEYYQQRVRQLDREERSKHAKLTLSDLFRKREMPTFNYKPRFASNGGTEQTDSTADAEGQALVQRMRKRKISRRFDMGDVDYMKPISAGKIMIYALAATLMLLWILL